jgi:hypothetical protein
MAVERRTRITIETERILVVAGQRAIRRWCKQCGQEVEFVAQDQLGHLLGASARQPARWSQNKVHLQQAKDGLAICMKSLLRLARGNQD